MSKIAIVSPTFGRQCGIAEYAIALGERLGVPVVANATAVPTGTDIVFFQYERSFGDENWLQDELAKLRAPFVVLDDHQDNAPLGIEWSATLGAKHYWQPHVIKLPHIGYLERPPGEALSNGTHIGTFGFAVPNKRYELLIELSKRLQIPVTILAAEANATPTITALSRSYTESLHRQADGAPVEIISDFLRRSEVVSRLAACSHLLYVADDMNRTSGSLRLMARAGRPLIALPSRAAKEVAAIEVSSLDQITPEWLAAQTALPQPADGITSYRNLIHWYKVAADVQSRILHHDGIYLDDPRQMDRLEWLRSQIFGDSVDVGIGNGFSTNYLRSRAGVDNWTERVRYAQIRYPHIRFYERDAVTEPLFGFDTVILAEIIEHVPYEAARQMVVNWAATEPWRILLTTPNAGKEGYDPSLVHTSEHVWFPTTETVQRLTPKGWHCDLSLSPDQDFIQAVLEVV